MSIGKVGDDAEISADVVSQISSTKFGERLLIRNGLAFVHSNGSSWNF